MEFEEFSGKTIEDAITEACTKYTVTSSRLEYEIVDKGNSGFLGINSKPALIRARVKEESDPVSEAPVSEASSEEKEERKEEKAEEVKEVKKEEAACVKDDQNDNVSSLPADLDEEKTEKIIKDFLTDVFKAMETEAQIKVSFNKEDGSVDVDLEGPDMGVLIGKRGQTLDSLQYLLSLVVNKNCSGYIRIKVDTENYRKRRKDTLENLAKNLSFMVKRTRRPVSLEPMNPYERRIIHSALQNDRYVTTHSEGEEPFRRVVITLKR